MDERTFQGHVLRWLGEILDENPDLPFGLPEQERKPRGYRKPSDIVLYDREFPQKVAAVGELKLPDAPDGTSPDRRDVVQDTRNKADEFQAKWFLTWNVNDLILWDNSRGAVPLLERRFDHFSVDQPIFDRDELEKPEILSQYKPFLGKFLQAFASYYTGVAEIALKPLHRQFATALEVNLRPVIGALHRDLVALSRKDRALRVSLERYMVETLEWTLREEKNRSDDFERLARLCSYLLANKLIFYETLRAQGFSLRKLSVPSTVRTGRQLTQLMNEYFERACIASKDYETIFTSVQYGRSILTTDAVAFLSNDAVPAIRELASRIAEFDFTKFDYDVIGEIYQTLNDPRERHRFGQHYTLPEIVDLINAFCIQSPTDKVLDPACGGGTFLVRGYARKKYLARKLGQPPPPHTEMLQQLFGTDIAAHAVHLATVNLATRDLVPQPNYPLVDRKDFFDVEPETKLAHGWLPKGLDAVVTNPPYVRYQLIGNAYRNRILATLLQDQRKWVRSFTTIRPSGQSDIYVYFFLHSTPFIRERGYIGYITSNAWLNALYGVQLQRFFLENFRIIAVLESKVERWFSGAAIITAVTILQHEPEESKRNENIVRFVRFFTPLEKLLPHTRDEDARLAAVERLLQSIERCDGLTTTTDYRVNPVRQGHLLAEGTETDPDIGTATYVGDKWGKYLWAPNVFFKILERAGDRLCKLSQVATVRYGILTGSNDFFYVKDITDQLSDRELKQGYGLTRKDTKRLRVIEDGNGTAHIIEAEFLKPVITSPKEIDQLIIDPAKLPYRVLMVHKEKKELEGAHVLKYIKLGETRHFGKGERRSIPAKNPGCTARKPWYDLGSRKAGVLLWPMAHNDRPIVGLNRAGAHVDHNLFSILDCDETCTAVSLLSTFGILTRETYGRVNLGEGGLKTEGHDIEKIPVLLPNLASAKRQELRNALDSIGKRPWLSMFEEVTLSDRRKLDDQFLEAVGFQDPEERRTICNELYAATTEIIRDRLERATQLAGIPEEAKPKARKQVNVPVVAAELWQAFDVSALRSFPADFLPETDKRLVVEKFDFGDGEIEVHGGLYGAGEITVGAKTYSLGAVSRAEFAKYAIESTGQRTVEIPTDPNICLQAVKDYEAYVAQLRSAFRALAETRAPASDPKLIRKLEDELMHLAALHSRIR